MRNPSQEVPTVAPLLVLDTNVVLDWLVFRNPEGASIGAALAHGRVRWIATAAMRDELAHVLARGALDAWRPCGPDVWAAWSAHCAEVPSPALAAPMPRLRCTDLDDQKFIDLAAAHRVRWLLTRDRAVLKLARRLRDHGVEVMTPSAWGRSIAIPAAP